MRFAELDRANRDFRTLSGERHRTKSPRYVLKKKKTRRLQNDALRLAHRNTSTTVRFEQQRRHADKRVKLMELWSLSFSSKKTFIKPSLV